MIRICLIVIVGIMLGPVGVGGQDAISPVGEIPMVQAKEKAQDGKTIKDLERERYKVYIAATIAGIICFIVCLALLTVVRQWRFYRKRLGMGEKIAPTVCEDLWSQYRLKDQEEEPNDT
ncbi:MAG: hypothetical protein K9M57_00560 [Phycisphaerae bacterium]|nr:hypothetical protein [Phycisphaerae bacterium]